MTISATEFRANLYRILDRVADHGEVVEIVRHGKVIRVISASAPRDLSRLPKHPEYLKCDPDEIVHMDWSNEWKP